MRRSINDHSKWRVPSKRSCIFLVLLALMLVASSRVHTQTPPATANAAPKPLPTRIIYGQLFKHVLFLDQQADLADQHGKDGNQLRNYYQRRGTLTPQEAASLKQIAHQADIDVKKLDDQIKSEVVRFRALLPIGKPHSKTTLPTPPDLKPLQDQKDLAILRQAAALQTLLGASRFQQFDAFARAQLTPHITVTQVPPTPGH